jgi:hypothetical protein
MPAKLGDICKWSETAIDLLLTTSNTQTFMFSAGLHFNSNEVALKGWSYYNETFLLELNENR